MTARDRSWIVTPAAVVTMMLYAACASAQEVSLYGFVQGNYAARVTGMDLPGPEGGDFVFAEERLQLKLSASSEKAAFSLKTDFFHDAIAEQTDLELREAYLDAMVGPVDLRAGRQIITWGVGDLLFINDLFPKDWGAFFSGRPLEYLKVGSDAVKLDVGGDWLAAELVVIPFFEADRLPPPQRFFVLDLFPGTPRVVEEPRAEFGNMELAARLYRAVRGFDVALYFYRGFFRIPAMLADSAVAPTRVELFFPQLAVYGASARGNALGGVLSLELGYYDSLDDRGGGDPSVPNSELRYLAGYQRQLGRDFTAGLQYYGETMQDHGDFIASLPPGFPARDRLRQLVTLRVTRLLAYQTLRLGLFAFYSPTDEDYDLIPEARYSLSDAMWVALSAHLLGGDDRTTFFGQLRDNDNVSLVLRYEF